MIEINIYTIVNSCVLWAFKIIGYIYQNNLKTVYESIRNNSIENEIFQPRMVSWYNVTSNLVLAIMSEHKEILSYFKHLEGLIQDIRQKMNMTNPNEVLTRNDVREQYHVSFGTIHNNMNNGTLKHYKKGAKTLFRRSDVDKWFVG